MITGLWSSASGMTAGSALLDALSVDLANINTTGYKRNRVDFAEVAAEAQY
ncbi:MAG: flagellar basal body rod protein FlgG, partial [Dactylosporangium sp.]|nr:flagellar basal body rod protein FlgG [Dactylosporangium sp.]